MGIIIALRAFIYLHLFDHHLDNLFYLKYRIFMKKLRRYYEYIMKIRKGGAESAQPLRINATALRVL
jgi:hypothetical protein